MLHSRAKHAAEAGVDAFLVGSSYLAHDRFDATVQALKSLQGPPVLIFPGNARQVSSHADGLLLLSLASGRNAQWLIGEHVIAAPILAASRVELIPTGYLLIESGRITSVQAMSQTIPLPSDKPDLTLAHALAAEQLGMRAIYLEAGSGAAQPVPVATVAACAHALTSVLIVGGGIRTPDHARERSQAGADWLVVGTAWERMNDASWLREMVAATHGIE